MASNIASGAIRNIPPDNPVTVTATSMSVAGVTIYTVPTGKTFYCTGMRIVSANAGTLDFTLKVAGTTTLIDYLPQDTPQEWNGNPLFIGTSGQAITLHGGATYTIKATMWGFYI